MKLSTVLTIVVSSTTLVTFILLPHVGFADESSVSKTALIHYNPKIPAGPVHHGKCWGQSIAAPRRYAWRCMEGNAIYDPCFMVGDGQSVVCGASPIENSSGFILAKPSRLPVNEPVEGLDPIIPWIAELDDGTKCVAMTGTLAFVGDDPIPYSCITSKPGAPNLKGPQTGLLKRFQRGTVWIGTKVVFEIAPPGASQPFREISRERVPIRTIWY